MANNTTEIGKPESTQSETPLCAQFPNRLAITGVLIDTVRQLFSSASNLLHPQLKEFYWAAEPTKDPLKAPYQLVIEDKFAFNINDAGIRPAILIKSGNWQEAKMLLGDKAVVVNDYYKRIAGTHSILVVAKTISQAELLAREVHGYLSHFGPLLREWMNLYRWEVSGISEPQKLEEHQENIVITIPLSYEIIYAWELQSETSRLLRQILVSAIMPNNTEIQLGA